MGSFPWNNPTNNPHMNKHVNFKALHIERNILECICKHTFSYVCKWMHMLWKHTYVVYICYLKTSFSLPYFEYKSMVFTMLRGCLPYSNDRNILECECTYGIYGSYYGLTCGKQKMQPLSTLQQEISSLTLTVVPFNPNNITFNRTIYSS